MLNAELLLNNLPPLPVRLYWPVGGLGVSLSTFFPSLITFPSAVHGIYSKVISAKNKVK